MLNHNLDRLVGKKITRIFLNEQYLKFETDGGPFVFTVEGDCCSRSVFYDFIGVRKLLENGPVTKVDWIDLKAGDIRKVKTEWGSEEEKDRKSYQEYIQVYGFAITTEHPEFGEMTSVFSFRNYSNGYYGGWMEACEDRDVTPEITDDVIETASTRSE